MTDSGLDILAAAARRGESADAATVLALIKQIRTLSRLCDLAGRAMDGLRTSAIEIISAQGEKLQVARSMGNGDVNDAGDIIVLQWPGGFGEPHSEGEVFGE
jgi:hypothetical protein